MLTFLSLVQGGIPWKWIAKKRGGQITRRYDLSGITISSRSFTNIGADGLPLGSARRIRAVDAFLNCSPLEAHAFQLGGSLFRVKAFPSYFLFETAERPSYAMGNHMPVNAFIKQGLGSLPFFIGPTSHSPRPLQEYRERLLINQIVQHRHVFLEAVWHEANVEHEFFFVQYEAIAARRWMLGAGDHGGQRFSRRGIMGDTGRTEW